MLFAIDIGNTNMVIGCIDGDKILFSERLSTDHSKTALEYALAFKNVGMEAVFGLVMGTVAASGVPEAIAAAILVTAITGGLMKSGVLRQNTVLAGSH